MPKRERVIDSLIQMTPRATKLMEKTFKGKKRKPIRLFVKVGGCGVRSFGMALEEPTDADKVFDIEGFQYVVSMMLLERVKPIKLDSDGFGFRISGSGVAPPHGCGNCGFMCSDGNRCPGDCAICSNPCGYSRRLLKKRHESGARGQEHGL